MILAMFDDVKNSLHAVGEGECGDMVTWRRRAGGVGPG